MEKTKKENHYKAKYEAMKKPLIIYSVFALVIMVVCFVFFIFNYKAAYSDSTDGGFISPSFGVKFYHAVIAVIFIGIALFVRAIWENDVKMLPFVLLSLILPFLCYFSNYNSFDKDGALYSLVDEGGMLHFIIIGDYNFDGINDERYHRTYDERTHKTCGSTYEGVVRCVDITATGIGYSLDATLCSINTDKSQLRLSLEKTVEYKSIELEIKLEEGRDPSDISFFMSDTETETELPFTVRDGRIIIGFDAEACKEFQNSSENRYIHKTIKYRVNEK